MTKKRSVVLCWADAWGALLVSSACIDDSAGLFHSVSPSTYFVHCPDDVVGTTAGVPMTRQLDHHAAKRHTI